MVSYFLASFKTFYFFIFGFQHLGYGMSAYVPLPLLYLGFIELLGCVLIFLSKNISFGGYETHILQFRLPCQVQLTGSDYPECCGGTFWVYVVRGMSVVTSWGCLPSCPGKWRHVCQYLPLAYQEASGTKYIFSWVVCII